jgi:AAA domain
MNELSDEQQIILKNVVDGHNVIVDSCAGTGKTTLILSVARALVGLNLLQMTYNSMLRFEVKDRVKKSGIVNMKVHTFHSLAVRYYLPTSYTDTGIRYIILKDLPPLEKIPKFDIFVLDEAQDMTFLYFQLMAKFARDSGHPIQLLILGDYMQGLYDFKGADIRFLTFADILWENFRCLKTQEFRCCTMKMSYRITNQMCKFVNEIMIGENRMEACRDGATVTYIRNSRFNIERIVAAEICKLMEQGYTPADMFVLAPSVKGANSNVRQLENILVERGIPCHVPMLENDKIDERVIDKKVVFSTFHCVKGRQRKFVFIVGFDQSYFKFYARNLPKDRCPNTLYVASTRATHGLYLLENDNFRTDRPLEFLKKTHIEMKQCDYVNFRGHHKTLFYEDDEDERIRETLSANKHNLTPTELIKFVPESVIEEISFLLDRIFISENRELSEIDIPNIIETRQGFFEEVSDLNGIAIPCIYYDYLSEKWSGSRTNSNILLNLIGNCVDNMKPNEHGYLKKLVGDLPEKIETIDDYLYVANISVAVQETLYFKLKQIDRDEYNWLTEGMIRRCTERLECVIGNECKDRMPEIEETIIHQSDEKAHARIDEFLSPHFGNDIKFRFTARTDLITELSVWEMKCTTKISIDHMLQVVIYAWLWRMQVSLDNEVPSDEKTFKIFNIKTNELLRLDSSMEDLNTIMLALLKGKFQKQNIKVDEEFIGDCRRYLNSL